MIRAIVFACSLFAAQAVFAEQTLSIIKPDAVASGHVGKIIEYFERDGLRIAGAKLVQLTPLQAKEFYAEHKERPFYNDLVAYMTSGPVFVQVLEGENAIARNRKLMGPTNPSSALEGTIRHDFGLSIQQNAVHGSDSSDSAKREIEFFFQHSELTTP